MSVKKLQIITPIVTTVNKKYGDVEITLTDLGIEAELAKKADKDHEHDYAKSNKPGGIATSADSLSISAGTNIQPVYFQDGVPIAINYTIESSVPKDAVFTDTTYETGTSSTLGITKLYDSTGTNTDGTMTQASLKKALDNKITPSITVDYTLIASDWTNDEAPYVYSITVEGVTSNSNQEIIPAVNVTTEQLAAMQSADIHDGGQSENTIILKAYGVKPTIDLPMRIILRGD